MPHYFLALLFTLLTFAVASQPASAEGLEPIRPDIQDMLESSRGRQVVFEALVELFRENYWDADYTDWDAWAARYRDDAYNAQGRQDFERVARTMVVALGDDHSRWLGRQDILPTREPDTQSTEPDTPSRPVLGFSYRYLAGQGLVVTRVYPDGAAARAGLQRGDLISHINAQSVGSDRGAAFTLLNGHAQASVRLRLHRNHQTQVLTVRPAPLDLAQQRRLPSANMLDGNIGYLHLPSFYRDDTAARCHALMQQLQAQGARKLVIDMRGNGGGRLDQLGLVLGIFLSEQHSPWAEAIDRQGVRWQARYRLVRGYGYHQLEDAEGNLLARAQIEDAAQFTGELAILVNQYTSSAGEVLPTVLRRYRQAYIIGEDTLGNMETITPFHLPDGSQVMIAITNLRIGMQLAHAIEVDEESLETLTELSRGFDAPLATALRLLKGGTFTPRRFF